MNNVNQFIYVLNDLFGNDFLVNQGIIINNKPTNKLLRPLSRYNLIESTESINLFEKDIVEVKTDKIQEVTDYIYDYIKDKRYEHSGTKPFKASKKDIYDRLKKFFNVYNFDIKIVKEKLELYCKKCYISPSVYHTCLAYYIINSDKGSLLATDCEFNGDDIIQQQDFNDYL